MQINPLGLFASSSSATRSRRELAFAVSVTLTYFALAAFAMAHHEMWRDELHCWLVARDSRAPWDVVAARAYDGQPPLWYALLWPLTRISGDAASMRAVHLAIATADVALVARFAPFPRFTRALFAFGYFVLYEYAAISRCYGLALLFVLLIARLHERRAERPFLLGSLLAALALTTTVGTLVAAGYAAALAGEWAFARGSARPARSRFTGASGRALVPIGLAAMGGLSAGLCAWPPADSTVAHVGTPPIMPWEFAATRVVAGLVPIPRINFFFWNSNLVLDSIPSAEGRFIFALALFGWVLFVLSVDAFAAGAFAASTALLVGLFSGVYSGSVRHHGFIYVAFVLSAWIVCGKDRFSRSGLREGALRKTIAALFALQIPGALIAISYDTKYIFSSGARAAKALKGLGLANSLFVAELDFPATAVLGQLGNDAMAYSPRNGRPFSFVRWTRDRSEDPTDEDTLRFAASLGKARGQNAVLLMNRPLLPDLVDGARVVRLAELYDSMIEEENFYIYRVAQAN